MSKSTSKKQPKDVLDQIRKLAKKHNKKSKHTSSSSSSSKKATSSSSKMMVPMTKEEYEKKRSTITTEYDAQTGRMRRKRATGEILETIVTKEQHLKINQMATLMDGLSYQQQAIKK